MFLLDSLMISGIRWALETVVTAAEAEMNDDTALREQLLEAEMRREMGEISDEEFAEIEADLLRASARSRSGARAAPVRWRSAARSRWRPPATARSRSRRRVSGDFHEPADAPHTTVIDTAPARHRRRSTVSSTSRAASRRRHASPDAANATEPRRTSERPERPNDPNVPNAPNEAT